MKTTSLPHIQFRSDYTVYASQLRWHSEERWKIIPLIFEVAVREGRPKSCVFLDTALALMDSGIPVDWSEMEHQWQQAAERIKVSPLTKDTKYTRLLVRLHGAYEEGEPVRMVMREALQVRIPRTIVIEHLAKIRYLKKTPAYRVVLDEQWKRLPDSQRNHNATTVDGHAQGGAEVTRKTATHKPEHVNRQNG